MNEKSYFFAGGGTGGHIYPAVAIAERIAKLEPEAKIHFFVSGRDIDSQILGQTGFEYTKLPAKGFSGRLGKLIEFCISFLRSYRIARQAIAESNRPTVIGIGGFVAAPVCFAAHKLKIPVVLLNLDLVPGRANKIIARWAEEVFVQFEETAGYFVKSRTAVSVVGCPLRSGFDRPQPQKARSKLGLDEDKKTLLITGASSGSENINNAVCYLLPKLNLFADDWQIVHLTGKGDYEKVRQRYSGAKIGHKVLRYCDDMADLLSAADLVIGRGGAVSVAEYAAALVPSICMPYPYHKDRHQYLNAGRLVEAGAGVIVDDLPGEKDRAQWLWEELEPLLKNDDRRRRMADNCRTIAKKNAALKIAEKLLKTAAVGSEV